MNVRWPAVVRSIRFRLLMAVNLPLAILATLFLLYDFRRELDHKTAEKSVALKEEAKTILSAVAELHREGRVRIQQYIDTVCARMRESDSPGHHIAVELPEGTLQARAHHRASPQMIEAMRQASKSPDWRAPMGGKEIIVGSYRENGLTVFVSERMATLRRDVWTDVVQRALAVVVLAGVGAAVVNIVLLRLVTVPLTKLVRVVRRIAQGRLESRAETFSSSELEFLAGEINQMGQALADADRYRNAQVAKAKEIQRHLLADEKSIEGLDLASRFLPADEVGGDYYDVLALDRANGDRERDGAVLLCVADVTGHGVSAAMATMLLRSLLHTAAESYDQPRDILAFINRHFWEATLPGDFASAFLARIDPRQERITYASAGHESAWLLSSDGGKHELESTGLILGIDELAEWDVREYDFRRHDRLLVVTDGVTETFGPNDEVFGSRRLVETFEQQAAMPLEAAVDAIKESLETFRRGTKQLDDITIVLASLPDTCDRSP